jgi:hypothetical protein
MVQFDESEEDVAHIDIVECIKVIEWWRCKEFPMSLR